MKEMTDRDLVLLAQQGRVDGFTELAARYYPALLAIAQSVLADKHLAEDAAQESLAKACSSLRGLRDPDRFGCWLARICRHTSVSLLRGRANLSYVEELPERPTHDEQDDEQDLDLVREVVRGLPSTYREVIYLRYYDGMTYERISAVLGLSVQALNGRLRRAKDLIRSQLKGKSPLED
ncbi:MAG: sigma-70 family RNA polymerase sigma factor [Phycisphaerae bacterium]|nr:sigma-70 family RNA polymerase sigma factor [Phycisphaerae bacterium]